MGIDQHIVLLPPHNWENGELAKQAIEKWYFPIKASVSLCVEGFQPAIATIATGWQTAYWVDHFKTTEKKFYFVQDFEPHFYPQSSEAVLAEGTYRLCLSGITAGGWLKKKLTDDYGMACQAISFSCDTSFYKPTPKRENSNFNILFPPFNAPAFV